MDMIITAQAHLRSLGFPTDICTEDLSQNQLRSLAGEAFGAPSCAVIMIAYYANPWAPWWKDVLPDDMRKPVGRQGGGGESAGCFQCEWPWQPYNGIGQPCMGLGLGLCMGLVVVSFQHRSFDDS